MGYVDADGPRAGITGHANEGELDLNVEVVAEEVFLRRGGFVVPEQREQGAIYQFDVDADDGPRGFLMRLYPHCFRLFPLSLVFFFSISHPRQDDELCVLEYL